MSKVTITLGETFVTRITRDQHKAKYDKRHVSADEDSWSSVGNLQKAELHPWTSIMAASN